MFDIRLQKGDAPARDESGYFDRLLRVSAPHERIVLAGAGLVLLAFAVWLFLGGAAFLAPGRP